MQGVTVGLYWRMTEQIRHNELYGILNTAEFCMYMPHGNARLKKDKGKHVMFLFMVRYWVPFEFYDGDVFDGLYTVRARNVADCVEVIFQEYCQHVEAIFQEYRPHANRKKKLTIPVVREQILQQVMIATKVKLYHRYRESRVLADYENRD